MYTSKFSGSCLFSLASLGEVGGMVVVQRFMSITNHMYVLFGRWKEYAAVVKV